jgi:hypothetical protein
MASPNVMRTIRAPGRMVVDPVDFRTAYPYGGTEIGLTRAVIVQPLGTSFRVESEGLGEATDVLEANNRWVVGFFLRGFDDDALTLLLSDYADRGAVTGHTHLKVPNRAMPGASGLTRARRFVFVPDDLIHVPAILIYRGIPDFQDGAEMAFQRGEELGLPMAVECLRDTQNRILEIGRLADMPQTP